LNAIPDFLRQPSDERFAVTNGWPNSVFATDGENPKAAGALFVDERRSTGSGHFLILVLLGQAVRRPAKKYSNLGGF